ncbi:MAG TPA: hypothetical protein VGI93_04695 [Steroidobacteraceae bacterium]|jgi:hypothetical protein
MQHIRNFTLVLSLSAWASLAGCASQATKEVPSSSQDAPGQGYSIKLLNITPTPGTPFTRGASATFHVSVSYKLTIADKGSIVLVFQDETNAHVGGASARTEAVRPGGNVTLDETLEIPQQGKELRLFVPIMPQGVKNTTGELLFRYPIVEHN